MRMHHVALLLALTPLACGDHDTGEGRFPVESGIDDKRSLQSLTKEETHQLCRATATAARTLLDSDVMKQYLCTLIGAVSSLPQRLARVDRASCERLRAECLRTAKLTPEDSDCDVARYPSVCAVSVSEYQACAERYFSLVADEAQGVSCASLASQPQFSIPESAADDLSQVPGCEHLQTACPDADWLSVSATVSRPAAPQ